MSKVIVVAVVAFESTLGMFTSLVQPVWMYV
jgi:hypothetical protein